MTLNTSYKLLVALTAALLVALLAPCSPAQAGAGMPATPVPQGKAAPQVKPATPRFPTTTPQSPAVKAPSSPQKNYPELKVYGSCNFPDGLQITDVAEMPPDVHDRPVQVHGTARTVPLLAGRRVTFGYTGGQPYASAKVELLPQENYAANRKLLLDDFDDIVASDEGVARNTARPPTISGFSSIGLDRSTITGNTLGIYLLLDDRTRIATTIYLLNPEGRIKTTADYARMRDTFLYNYTHCVRNNQNGALFGGAK